MFPNERELWRKGDIIDGEIVFTCCKCCSECYTWWLWGCRATNSYNLATLIYLHDGLSLLVSKSFEITFNNNCLTNLQIGLSCEVSTIYTLTREYLKSLIGSIIRDIIWQTLMVLIVESYSRDNTLYISLPVCSLPCLYLLYSFCNRPGSSFCIEISGWLWGRSDIRLFESHVIWRWYILATSENCGRDSQCHHWINNLFHLVYCYFTC